MSSPNADRHGPRPVRAPLSLQAHAARWSTHVDAHATRDAHRAVAQTPIPAHISRAERFAAAALHSRSSRKRTSG